jgi:hypothetical protein
MQLCFCRNSDDESSGNQHYFKECFHTCFLYNELQRAQPNCSRFVDCVSTLGLNALSIKRINAIIVVLKSRVLSLMPHSDCCDECGSLKDIP